MSAAAAIHSSIIVSVAVLDAKLLAWRLTGSVAMYSDALESVVNVVAAIAAALAVRVSARPPDADHPWGHGKVEYFSAVVEGALIAIAAVAIIHAAWGKLFHPAPLESLGLGLAVSIAATLANGVMGLHLVRRGRALQSPALHADGMHLLSDVLTTGGVLAGIGVAWATGLWVLDPLLAMLVALQIIRVGWRIVSNSVRALMDEALPHSEREHLDRAALEAAGGHVVEIVRARRAADRVFVELKVFVPSAMSVLEAHEICDRIEAAIEERFPRTQVTAHVEPQP